MGFAAGFTGGLTLTLAITYLSTVAHQRSREAQSLLVQQQSRTLDSTTDRPLAPLRLTRAELAAASRANLVDSAKDRWNSELEGAVRWLQTADWGQARERLEDRVGGLFVNEGVKETPSQAKADVYDQASQIKSGVLSALEEGLSKGKDVLKDARGLVSGRLQGTEAAVQEVDLPESDIKKALKQRYEGATYQPSLLQKY
ncbi:unnamed protein product [Parascedosporium putredinis]|uniref:MICOS complex subunit MIC12 n=1 Tax=Parascedosporium putredinis TaxID=1442378 RepID=A0A9P1M9S5_9PEZI|nr:unnamed protein product [Parascedosporium putredinis]CAI7991364.1 unnamed protein product [Parascedosporium putredinis]